MYAEEFGFVVKQEFTEIFNGLEAYMSKETDHLKSVFDDVYKEPKKGKYGERKINAEGGVYSAAYSNFNTTINKGTTNEQDRIFKEQKAARNISA